MKTGVLAVVGVVAACGGYAVGYASADGRVAAARDAARVENYTDRARLALEAAARLRAGDTAGAIAFLEEGTLHALRGVPMGRAYAELPAKSQALLVSAKVYEGAVPGADFEVERLAGAVPGEHAGLSAVVRGMASSKQ